MLSRVKMQRQSLTFASGTSTSQLHTIEVEPSGDAVIYRYVVTLPHVAMLENIGTLGYFSPHAFSG